MRGQRRRSSYRYGDHICQSMLDSARRRTEVAGHLAGEMSGALRAGHPGRLARDDGNGAAPGVGWARTDLSDSRRLAPRKRNANSAPRAAGRAGGFAAGRLSERGTGHTGSSRQRGEQPHATRRGGTQRCVQREQTSCRESAGICVNERDVAPRTTTLLWHDVDSLCRRLGTSSSARVVE